MANIKVSVIIPVYNTSEYLPECLDSLVNQTLKEIEIICVDDGSTDNSVEILEKYAKEDNRIKILTQQNLYAGVARNKGLSEAKGEFVIFLDSDDFFDTTLLEKTYTKAMEEDAQIVLFGGKKYDHSTNEIIENPYYLRTEILPEKTVFSKEDMPDNFLLVTTPCPWTKLFSKKFIQQEGLQFQPLQNSNDAFFVISALCVAERITAVDEQLVYYRINHGGSLQYTKSKNSTCFFDAYEAIYKNLKQRKIYEQCQKSFEEIFISGIIYNIDTCKTSEARLAIYKKLQSPEFLSMGVLDHDISYYRIPNNIHRIKSAKYICDYYPKMNPEKKDSNFCTIAAPDTSLDAPLVSVIIPVYNVEPYLRECLDSICSQTLKNIEIICINDGSTDGSLNILQEYSKQDKRISVYSQTNSGQSAARNEGIKRAVGKYLYFMDSDDVLNVSALEILCHEAESKQLDVVYFDGQSFSDDENLDEEEIKKFYYIRKHKYSKETYTGQELMSSMVANGEYKESPCLQLIRTEHFIKNNLWFYAGIIHEDNLFNYKCMLLAERVSHVPEVLFNRRLRSSSTMTSHVTFLNVYGYFICYMEMLRFFEDMRYDGEDAAWLIKPVLTALNCATIICMELPPEEKLAYHALSPYYKAIFELNILSLYRVREEKSEINRKLKLAYAQKSEINETLDTVRRKSAAQNGEIVCHLKNISNLKEERVALKSDAKKLKAQAKKLKAQAKKLEAEKAALKRELVEIEQEKKNLQASTSYKIGRIITWLPRKIKSILWRT